MELFHAANQWATRPADERFRTLEEMYTATRAYRETARQAVVNWNDLRVEAVGDELVTVGKAGIPATLTHHAFGQIAGRVGAPAGYLRQLPTTLAAQNLNHGLREREDGEAHLLVHQNGSLLLRAATSEKYERVWNFEVVDRLRTMADMHGLVPAQKTFDWSQRRPGEGDDGLAVLDPNADRALYASDHDMFAFLMDPQKVVIDPTGQPLRRGIIAGNSEVGAGSLWFMSFLFRDVCANHIIWGASGVLEVRLRHVGNIRNRWRSTTAKVRQYFDGSANLEEAKMRELTLKIGDSKEEVLETLFGRKSLTLSRKLIEASYDAVVPEEDGDPRTVWGMAQGMTRVAQEQPHADERHQIDRAAGKLLTLNF